MPRLRQIRDRVIGDFLMPSGLDTYRRLLSSALEAGYEFTSIERFWRRIATDEVDTSRPSLILRHDIDTDPRTAAEMWEIERTLGITGSYYFRLSTLDLDLMGRIASDGGEVSYHYEELATIAKERHLRDRGSLMRHIPEAQDLFLRNLDSLRTATGQPMRIVSSHGDFVNRLTGLPNWAILLDPRIRRLGDIDLEVYDGAFTRRPSSHHTDTGYPRGWTPTDLGASIDAGAPVVSVLVHPRNWQARPIANARDDLRRLREDVRLRIPFASRSETDTRPLPGASGGSLERGPLSVSSEATSPGVDRPRLVVRAPAAHETERRYVLDVILDQWLGLDYRLIPGDEPGVTITLEGDEKQAVLELPEVLFATPDADWLTERSMPVAPLPRLGLDWDAVRHPDETGARVIRSSPLPALFAGRGVTSELYRRTPTGIVLGVDVLGAAFFMLTRYEEVVSRFTDDHERYPSYASLAVIEGFMERPIVDETVDALWVAMHELWPALTRRTTAFRLRLTHDVDHPWAALGQPANAVLRRLSGDLLRRRDPVLAGRRAGAFISARAGRLDVDPYNTFDLLMDTSERHDIRSTFYFLAGETGAREGRYRLSDPPIRALLKRIHGRGHEVGLHASYGTFRSPELIEHEITDLKQACADAGIDQPIWGVRQHYLRFEIPITWRAQDMSGLDHDSTLGFADYPGFRAGTCREFPVFDILDSRALRLRERPIIIMDTTWFGYHAMDPDQAASRTRSIVETCRRYRGDAVLLYHNSTLTGTRLRAHYQELVEDLAQPG